MTRLNARGSESMAIVISLSPEVEARLREKAAIYRGKMLVLLRLNC